MLDLDSTEAIISQHGNLHACIRELYRLIVELFSLTTFNKMSAIQPRVADLVTLLPSDDQRLAF